MVSNHLDLSKALDILIFNCSSDLVITLCRTSGVPRGSILEPLLSSNILNVASEDFPKHPSWSMVFDSENL